MSNLGMGQPCHRDSVTVGIYAGLSIPGLRHHQQQRGWGPVSPRGQALPQARHAAQEQPRWYGSGGSLPGEGGGQETEEKRAPLVGAYCTTAFGT